MRYLFELYPNIISNRKRTQSHTLVELVLISENFKGGFAIDIKIDILLAVLLG